METYQNRQLCNIIKQINQYPKEELPLALTHMLNVELYVSYLYCPLADEQSIQLMCSESSIDELFIPAFTSLEKYYDFFGKDSFRADEISFAYLLENLSDDVIGIMINPASDDFFLPRDYLEDIEKIDFPIIESRNVSKSEYKELLASIDNSDIFEDLQGDDFIFTENFDRDKFIDFLKSMNNRVLFVMLTTSGQVKGKSKDGIYQTRRVPELGSYILSNDDYEKILAFSDESLAKMEHTHRMVNHKFFIQTVSFAHLVHIVLEMGIDTLIINHSTNPIFLHRDLLILGLNSIIKYAHNPNLDGFENFVKQI